MAIYKKINVLLSRLFNMHTILFTRLWQTIYLDCIH